MIPTYSKDGHLFFREITNKPESILGDRLIINPQKIKESCIYVKRNGIKSITINPSYFKVDNLNFLDEFSFIEGLYVLQGNLDLHPITRLINLRVLTLSDLVPKIDLISLLNLQVLGITFNKNILNLDKCKSMFWLWLDNFKKTNLEELSMLSELRYLNLHKTGIVDLKGISKLEKLINLKIDTANNLETLNGITENNKWLKVIDIYGAKSLQDCSSLRNANGMEKILLRKTGDLQNVFFLQDLKNLQEIAIGSKITDGNIRLLKEIPVANFLDFPHYNLKMKELK